MSECRARAGNTQAKCQSKSEHMESCKDAASDPHDTLLNFQK